jgi:predicted nucleic acid-binding protein
MNNLTPIVSDTGPLISLEKLNGGYNFISQLYDKIIVPQVVLEEVAQGQFENSQAYLHHYDVTELIEVREPSYNLVLPEIELLHLGEIQAIRLAFELNTTLLIEETAGRRVANQLCVHISGIAGQVVKAFRQDIISAEEARNKLNELLKAGRINYNIHDALVAVVQ